MQISVCCHIHRASATCALQSTSHFLSSCTVVGGEPSSVIQICPVLLSGCDCSVEIAKWQEETGTERESEWVVLVVQQVTNLLQLPHTTKTDRSQVQDLPMLTVIHQPVCVVWESKFMFQ